MKDDLGWSEYEKGLVLVSTDRFLVHTASLTFALLFSLHFTGDIRLDRFPPVGSFSDMELNGSLVLGIDISLFFTLFL
jgi:hypothetical protein